MKMSNEEYHADLAFSSHQLQLILKSPALFYERVILGQKQETTGFMVSGTLLHTLVLEPELADTEKHLHKLSHHPIKNISAAAAKLRENFAEEYINDRNATIEESIFFDYEGIALRARPDLYIPKGGFCHLLDVKSTKNIDTFYEDAVIHWGYDFQAAFYALALESKGLQVTAISFLAVELKPPFRCKLISLQPDDFVLAQANVKCAIMKLKRCLETGEWK